MKNLAAALAAIRTRHQYRRRAVMETPQGAEIVIDGTPYLSFCSNDYLGLANHPQMIAALKEGADKYGVGSGASHIVTGHQQPHHELEEALAAFTQRPRALLFSTGYMANLGVVATLAGRGDAVFEDRLNHASLLDAGLLSGARLRRYAHNDVEDLTRLLAKKKSRHGLISSPSAARSFTEETSPSLALASRPDDDGLEQGSEPDTGTMLILTDGVFRMDGDLAPLPQLAAILLPSVTPLQPLLVGDSILALVMSAALRAHGIYVTAIRPPTVPTGTASLRITVSAAQSEAQVERLHAALETVL